VSDFEMYLRGTHDASITLFDLTNFLFDLNIGYEIVRLATDPKYDEFKFSHHVYYRKGRPLRRADRIQVVSFRVESPLDITIAIPNSAYGYLGVVGIIFLVGQITTITAKVLRAYFDASKARSDARAATAKADMAELELRKAREERVRKVEPLVGIDQRTEELLMTELERRHAAKFFEGIEKRIQETPIMIEDIKVRIRRRRRK
jgi:hypothetical protein